MKDDHAKAIGKQIGIDWDVAKFSVSQFRKGLAVEREHGEKHNVDTDVGGDRDAVAGKIAWAHLKELADYYDRLEIMESKGAKMTTKEAELKNAYDLGCELAIKEAFRLFPKSEAKGYMTHGKKVSPVSSLKKKPLSWKKNVAKK